MRLETDKKIRMDDADFLQVDNDLCGPALNEFAWGGDHVIADLSKSTT